MVDTELTRILTRNLLQSLNLSPNLVHTLRTISYPRLPTPNYDHT